MTAYDLIAVLVVLSQKIRFRWACTYTLVKICNENIAMFEGAEQINIDKPLQMIMQQTITLMYEMYVYKVKPKLQHQRKPPAIMKALFAIILLSLTVMMHTAIVDNGKPSCDTKEQMEIVFFRNIFDPTAYWVCVELNEPAVLQRCPYQTAFMDSIKSCVIWDEWEWENSV